MQSRPPGSTAQREERDEETDNPGTGEPTSDTPGEQQQQQQQQLQPEQQQQQQQHQQLNQFESQDAEKEPNSNQFSSQTPLAEKRGAGATKQISEGRILRNRKSLRAPDKFVA